MADFDPALYTSQDFDPALYTAPAPVKERGMVSKLGRAALSGAGAEVTGVLGKTLGMAGAGLAVIGDKVRGAVTGNEDTVASDWAFRNLVDPMTRAAESFAPTEEEAASIPLSVAHGLGSMAVDLPLIAYTGGKVGLPEAVASGGRALTGVERAVHGVQAMAPVAAAHGVSQAATAVEQGVDLPTAYQSGAVSALTTAAMGAVPLAMRGGIPMRAATGAASGLVMGEVSRQAQNAVMSDYPELQTELNAKDAAVSAATGAMLGVVMGPRPIKTKINKAIEDAQADVDAGTTVDKPLQLENKQTPLVVYPDGTVSRGHAETEAFIAKLPENEQVAARAKLYGFGEQTGAIEQIQAGDVSRRLAEYAKSEATPFAETIPARSQAHVADMATLRDAGEVPTGDPVADGARAFALHNDAVKPPVLEAPPLTANPVSDGTNTQMRDALMAAQRIRDVEAGKQGTQDGLAAAELTAEQTKARDLDAIQRIAHGEKIDAAVARGEVPPGPTLPSSHNEFLGTLMEILPEGQKLPAKLKQELTQAVMGKGSYEAQLEAIKVLQTGKKPSTVGYDLLGMMHDKLTEGMAKPGEAAAEAKAPEGVAEKGLDISYGKDGAKGAFLEGKPLIGEGSESTVYKDGNRVVKVSEPYSDKSTEGYDARVKAATQVDQLLGDGTLQVIGHYESANGTKNPVFSQAHVEGRDATRDEIQAHMASRGFEVLKAGKHTDTFVKREGETEIVAKDLDGDNVKVRADGTTAVIDASLQNRPAETVVTKAPEAAASRPVPPETAAAPVAKTARETLQEARNNLDAVVAERNGMSRAEQEALHPDEKARYAKADMLRTSMERSASSRDNDATMLFYADMANETMSKESWAKVSAADKLARVPSQESIGAEMHRPDLEAVLAKGGTVKGALAHLKENGSTQAVKDTAALLDSIGLNTTLISGEMVGLQKGAAGGYNTQTDQIGVTPGMVSEATVIHEITHAAAYQRVLQAQAIEMPRNQAEAKLKAAYTELERVRVEAMQKQGGVDQYGLTNAHEFLAELKGNPEFREFLQSKSLWTRTVEAIRKLLGLSAESKTLLDRALAIEGDFISKEAFESAKANQGSPEVLAREVDPQRRTLLKGLAGAVMWSAGGKAFSQPKGLVDILRTNNLKGSLDHVAANGSSMASRALAARLAKMMGDVELITVMPGVARKGGIPGSLASAYGVTQRDAATGKTSIWLRDTKHADGLTGMTEETLLHEALHAALISRYGLVSKRGAALINGTAKPMPGDKAMMQIVDMWRELGATVKAGEASRKTANENTWLMEPFRSPDEFIAYAMTSKEFQVWMKGQKLNKEGVWTKFVSSVKSMLGLGKTPTYLETVMDATYSMLDSAAGIKQGPTEAALLQQKFNSSPKGAAEVTDNVLSRIAKAADEDKTPDWGRADRYVFQKSLGWKTVQFIADRVRALPEMVQSGFSRALDGYEVAYKNRNLANTYAEGTAAKFATGVQKMLHGMNDAAKARELNRLMSEVGVGSSIGGFDPSLNFEGNLKTRPDLSPTNKAYIDGIYRKFKASSAETQKAIIEGAQVNRKSYVLDASTILSNLMDASIGNARRLEAELQRMDPADANRVRLADRTAAANQEANLAVQHAAGLDFMGKGVQNAINRNPAQHIDGASFILDQRVKAAFAAAKLLPDGSQLKSQLGEMEGKYMNQIDNPYYHAGRSGDYFVKVGFKGMDDATWDKMKGALTGTNKVLGDYSNQDHAFFRVDSADQAQGLRRKLEAAGGDKIVMAESAHGKLAEAGQLSNNAGISAALRSVLATLHDTVENNPGLHGEQASAMKEAMTRKFLSMLPESSTRLATIKRMGVPGYDGDFLGSFAKRASGGIQDTANIYAMRSYTNAFTGMKAAVESMSRSGNIDMQSRAQMVHDEITTRYTNSMKPVDTSHVNMINSLGHSFYLALAPAFFIRTMAQPFHRGLPILGSRYGFVQSAKEIAGATGVAMKVMAATIKQGWEDGGARGVLDAGMKFEGMGLSKSEEAFVQELHDRGVLNLGQARQLQRMALGGSQKMQDLARFTSMTAQYAEMTNRLSTGLAAFRLAEKGRDGVAQKGTAANTEYAIKAIDYAMDNFDPNNTARQIGKHGIAGKVTPLMTAFMNYNLQTMQQIARTVHDGVFSRDQSPEGMQRSKEAKKELAGIMGTTAMLSGAMGLPFVNAFAGVYNWLTKDEDNPSDIRQDVRNSLSNTFGETGGNLLAHGIGQAVGVDTSTFGLENLLPGTEFLASRRLMKDRIADQSEALMGPALNAFGDMWKGASLLSDGYYVKGIEQMLPAGVKGYWKAGQIATRGYTDAKGNPIGLEASPWDIAVQATGLRPADKANQAEASNYFSTNEQLLNHRKGVITDDIYKSVTQGDASDQQGAFSDMGAFNAKNPLEPIKDVSSIFRQKATELAIAKLSGTGVSAAKSKLPVLHQQLRFINNGAMPEY